MEQRRFKSSMIKLGVGIMFLDGGGVIDIVHAKEITQTQANASIGHSVPSQTMNVEVTKDKIQLIPDVIYEQVPSRGYQNVAMGMNILQPQKNEKMPAILFITGGDFINANKANDIQLRMHLAEAGDVVASMT